MQLNTRWNTQWNAGRKAGDRSRARERADRAAAHARAFLRALVRVLTHAAPVRVLTRAVPFAFAAACTFPDVDYAGAGGSCPGLSPCTDAASSCAASANSAYATCMAGCHGSMGCLDNCDKDHTTALSTCDATCTSCAPQGCSSAMAACQTAVGM
jgi:hypothetical protein